MKKENYVQGELFPDLGSAKSEKKQSQLELLRRQNDQYCEKIAQLQQEMEQLQKERSRLKSKADAFDALIESHSLFPISVIAKSLGRSAIWLNKYLQQKKVQYFRSDMWMLYAKYERCGYTGVCWYNYAEDSQGVPLSRPHTYWTSKGMMFIRSLLEKDGLL